ncbi:carbohydrate-binding protein, partial [Microbacterium testaceum]
MSTKTRAVRRWVAAAAVGVLGAGLLAGCSADGRETIRFTFSKREALT